MLKRLNWQLLLEGAWAVTLLCLPVTSFPWISDRWGFLVAPLSALPLILLLVVWLIPYLWRRGALPKESQPLFWFVIFTIVISALAFFTVSIPGFREKSMAGQELRAFVTLAIGLSFYLVTAALPQDEPRLRRTLLWINIGGALLVAWTMLQAYYIYIHPPNFPKWVWDFQDLLVASSPFTFLKGSNRISGLAYEPSWFAHQLNLLYFPLWLSAVFNWHSAFPFRIFKLPLELFLLIVGMGEFMLSSPRVGMLALLMMLGFLFIKAILILYRKLMDRFSNMRAPQQSGGRHRQVLLKATVAGISLALILVIFSLMAGGAVRFASQRDPRIALLLENPPRLQEIAGVLSLDEDDLVWMGMRFAFLERVVYWLAGWRTFGEFPLFGVGLGNTGFFFAQNFPSIGYATYEIRDVIYRFPGLPNVKSLWVRLLSETGVAGFSIFLAWLFVLWQSARLTHHSPKRLFKSLALAGQLALIALVAEGFSIDSFALPYLWVSAGLISASGCLYRKEVKAGLYDGPR